MDKFTDLLSDSLKETALMQALFVKNEDNVRIAKAELFAKKLVKQEYMIGFAGHFSAGKSSMINALTGEQLLPTSPIPTSANIVKVHKSEEDYAIIHVTEGEPIRFSGNYDFELIKSFGKDGSTVSQIEIGHKNAKIPSGVTVMDTPGVDSTDDAHRLSTESALHLADVVFYVMDYNHVQSELNFQFTKELLKYNNRLYLVVNQIDKHRESELPFEAFKKSVHDAFLAWGVEPQGIYFTSLKDRNHPYNDFEKVKSIVMNSMENWKDQLIESSTSTIEKLRDEHLLFLEEEKLNRIEASSETMTVENWEQRVEIIDEYKQLREHVDLLNAESWKRLFEKERKDILQNAVIMTYQVRNSLKNYLEAKQPQFKVGLLFSSKKTETERGQRAADLHEQLTSVVTSQLTVHIKNLMKNALKRVGLLVDEESLTMDKLSFELPFSLIDENVPSTSILTGDTVLNVSNLLSDVINKWLMSETDQWKEIHSMQISSMSPNHTNAIRQKVEKIKQKVDAIQSVEEIEQTISTFKKELTKPSKETLQNQIIILDNWKHNEVYVIEYEPLMEKGLLTESESESEFEDELVNVHVEKQTSRTTKDVIADAEFIAKAIEPVLGFKETATYLRRKAERLNHQEFTIALFGAFSAGKSSFSNALMGASVLPVSPNPTTATINRIRPVSEQHAHETADVKMKTIEQMTKDVQQSFKELNVIVASLDEAYEKAKVTLSIPLADDKAHVHKAFIAAFEDGYRDYKDLLGQTITVNRQDFEKFVAEERQSCFVDMIDFYYDCELTRLGVTLVDTPGADSINARHTGVAFEYIKNADAILFITYFNHAFAKADREFLIQLGRVKDAFELDKMFFVVNAIDLANDEEEAEEVKSYVRNELQRFGIRFPRLYGLSSLQSLHDKMQRIDLNENMQRFESDFHQFLSEDLSAMAVQSLHEENEKAINRLASLIRATEENSKRKDERLVELSQIEKSIQNKYQTLSADAMIEDTKNELNELFYYVIQRVYYRYSEFFKEAYHPGLFAKHKGTTALEIALKDLLQMLSFDFEQEMRVTNFRIGNFIRKKINARFNEEIVSLRELNDHFNLPQFESSEHELLLFEGPLKEISHYSNVKSYYRNNKSFFEQNEREKLKDALEIATKRETQKYVEDQTERIFEWAKNWIRAEVGRLNEHLQHQAISQIETERELLLEGNSLEIWKETYEIIRIRGNS